MRRIQEFKSYRSAIDYDVETGQFIVTPMPDVFSEESEDADAQSAEIVLFPEPAAEPLKRRRAG